MSDRPILFSATMIRAILSGSKNQTRRILSFNGQQPVWCGDGLPSNNHNDWGFRFYDNSSDSLEIIRLPDVPKIKVADRLWVREAWRAQECFDDQSPKEIMAEFESEWGEPSLPTFYEADKRCDDHSIELWQQSKPGRLRAAMHMPRLASRITLSVTGVKVERLQDISEEDAIAEGVNGCASLFNCPEGPHGGCCGDYDARTAFKMLWESIHGPGAWDKNPWVAAYSFEVIKGNIETLKGGAS